VLHQERGERNDAVHACCQHRIMCCDDQRAAASERDQRVGNGFGGERIEMRSRLIRKDEGGFWFRESTRERETRGFATRNSGTTFSDQCRASPCGRFFKAC